MTAYDCTEPLLWSPLERARRHPVACERAAPDFFSGALLGNGGMGVVVTTRPDAVLLHVAHNNVWDQRIAELDKSQVGTFEEVFGKVKALSPDLGSLVEDDWYREYCLLLKESYNKPYPRPMPCGTVLLGFDRRKAEVLGHTLDIADGICEVHFLVEGQRRHLRMFVDAGEDRLWLSFTDEERQPCSSPFDRIKLMPDPSTPGDIPAPDCRIRPEDNVLSFRQMLPYEEVSTGGHPKDRAFALTVRLSQAMRPRSERNLTRNGIVATHLDDYMAPGDAGHLDQWLSGEGSLWGVVALAHGFAHEVPDSPAPAVAEPLETAYRERKRRTEAAYEAFWERSGVRLDDEELERVWYRNLYFFQCGVKDGYRCPGLFANWLHDRIGSAWHGDYHLDYNTQQPFWLAFSSNHAERHLPYVEMVHHITPVSRRWAEDYYGLRGAFYPVSAYPVDMTINPNAGPPFGWVMCTTPWVVQSLWWHYLYTMDIDYLRDKGFEPIRLAVLFMVDYMKRPDASGSGWDDDRYHIFPTVPPELYGLMPGLAMNADSIADLTLTKFIFRAYLQACRALVREEEERALIAEVRDILERFPDYPTAESAERGTVFVSVKGEDPEMVYNTPNSAFTVFPGEEHGLHSPPEVYEIACSSYLNHRNEGGNELVFHNLQGARLGILDLERFKRQIRYCMMPNGACTDMVLQTGGRYEDTLPFDFMARMGVWFENTALPVVINECLLQSYSGQLRLFPNWPMEKRAEFKTLRAVGGFLVSASASDGAPRRIEILSEAGQRLRLIAPWPEGAVCVRGDERLVVHGDIDLPTRAGETLVFESLLP